MNFKKILIKTLMFFILFGSFFNCTLMNTKNDDDDKKNQLLLLYILQNQKQCLPHDHEDDDGDHSDHVHC